MSRKASSLFLTAFLIVFVILTYGAVRITKNNGVVTVDRSILEIPSIGITKGVTVKQDILAEYDGLSSVAISFGNYMRESDCNINISISDSSKGTDLFYSVISGKNLVDNSFIEFCFKPVTDSKGHIFTVTVTTDADDSNSVALWKNSYEDGSTLMINETKDTDNLAYIAKYEFKDKLINQIFLSAVTMVLGTSVLIAALVKFRKIKKTQNILLLISSLFISFSTAVLIYILLMRTDSMADAFIKQPALYFELAVIFYAAFYVIFGMGKEAYDVFRSEAAAFFKRLVAAVLIAAVYISAICTVRTDGNGHSVHIGSLFIFVTGIVLIVVLASFNPELNVFIKGHAEKYKNDMVEIKRSSKTSFALCVSADILFVLFILFIPIAFWFYSGIARIGIFAFSGIVFISQSVKQIYFKKSVDFAKLFLILALLTGFMFAFTEPFSTRITFDDQIHFSSSVKFAHMITGGGITEADLYLGYFSDESITPDELFTKMLSMEKNHMEYQDAGSVKLSTYTYLGYIPVALCVVLQNYLKLPYYIFMVLSRFSNVLVYSFVLYKGIKRMKSGQLIFSVIALFPINMLIAANYSYDYWVNAFIGYSMAYFIGICQDDKRMMSITDMIKLTLAIFIGCGPKAIYFVLIIPFVLIGKDKFGSTSSRRNFIALCTVTAALIAITFAMPFLSDSGGATDVRGGNDVNSSEQLKFIITEPLGYAKILLRYIGQYMSVFYASLNVASYAYIGNAAEWASSASLLIMIFAVFTDKSECDNFRNNGIIRIGFLVSSMAAIVLACSALYIAFTPVRHPTINGMQWRYQVPALFGIAYSMGSTKTKCELSRANQALIVYGGMFIVLYLSYYSAYIVQFVDAVLE